MTAINNLRDIIDSRDVIERIEDLRDERAGLVEDVETARADDEAGPDELASAEIELAEWEANYADELAALENLAAQAEPYSGDWGHGAALIRDSYFVEHAQELADDIGAIDRRQSWPARHIDWDAAAAALQRDYTAVDYDGVTYWIR